MSNIYFEIERIKDKLKLLKLNVRKYETDEAYKEYCEGVIDAAIKVLEVIRT
jgi:hypothetical protein